MQLERLRYFVALAEERHFGRAAERLHLSQPALSQQVRRLERELGTTLCERTPRGIDLTASGRALADGAARLLTDYDRLVEEARQVGAGGRGTLRVAYTRSGAELGSHALIARYGAANPLVTVHTEVGWTSWNLAQLRAGAIDAAFVRAPVRDRAVRTQLDARSEMVVVIPHGHPLASRRRISPDELRSETLVFWARDQAPAFHDTVIDAVWGPHPPTDRVTEPDAEHILAAVAAGAGFGVLDRAHASTIRRSGVLVRRFTDAVPTTELVLAWRHARVSPALRQLISMSQAPLG